VTVANFFERLITCRTLKIGFYARYDRWLADRRKTEKAEPKRELWLAIVFARAPSASIKAIVNGEMSVACPATRRDGRRRLRLRNKEAKVRNFKLQTAKVKVFKLETSKLRSQNWNPKLRKWKSSKLRADSFQLLSFDKLQVLKLRIRTACSKLSYQSWKLSNVESCWIFKVESWKLFESCQILKLLNIESYQSWKLLKVVECWKLLNLESCQTLKVVECWKFANCKNLLSTNKFSKAFILYTIWY